MRTYVALLRAINVGGTRKVAMADLRDCVSELGFEDAQTLLQTGNIVFKGPARSAAALERLLEAESAQRLDLETDFLVRTAPELASVVAGNPFSDEAKRDPGHLVVQFLKDAPKATDVEALQRAIVGRETVRAHGKHLYVVYPDGIGRSKLTSRLIESTLGTRGTGRNWNTILKLAKQAGG